MQTVKNVNNFVQNWTPFGNICKMVFATLVNILKHPKTHKVCSIREMLDATQEHHDLSALGTGEEAFLLSATLRLPKLYYGLLHMLLPFVAALQSFRHLRGFSSRLTTLNGVLRRDSPLALLAHCPTWKLRWPHMSLLPAGRR